MNEKTRAQIEAMKNQTIGVEVEMNNITREKAAKKAAEFFGTGRYEYTAGRNGYCTWSAWDAQGREWKFQRDVSIEGSDMEYFRLLDEGYGEWNFDTDILDRGLADSIGIRAAGEYIERYQRR